MDGILLKTGVLAAGGTLGGWSKIGGGFTGTVGIS
jgi:hypothetical protein